LSSSTTTWSMSARKKRPWLSGDMFTPDLGEVAERGDEPGVVLPGDLQLGGVALEMRATTNSSSAAASSGLPAHWSLPYFSRRKHR
jgi:hypothetical protein